MTPGDEDFGGKIGEKTGKNMTFTCSSRCLGSDLPQVLVSSAQFIEPRPHGAERLLAPFAKSIR